MKTVKQEYIVKYYDNGNKWIEGYYINGKLHRENGIAYKRWHQNGNKWVEEYCVNGKTHRENGIAFKRWYENGKISYEQYWLNGKQLSEQEFNNRKNSMSGKVVEIDGKKYELKEIKEIKLKPCKVCNAKSSQIMHRNEIYPKPWSIYCNSCGSNKAEVYGDSKEDVINKWNARKFS